MPDYTVSANEEYLFMNSPLDDHFVGDDLRCNIPDLTGNIPYLHRRRRQPGNRYGRGDSGSSFTHPYLGALKSRCHPCVGFHLLSLFNTGVIDFDLYQIGIILRKGLSFRFPVRTRARLHLYPCWHDNLLCRLWRRLFPGLIFARLFFLFSYNNLYLFRFRCGLFLLSLFCLCFLSFCSFLPGAAIFPFLPWPRGFCLLLFFFCFFCCYFRFFRRCSWFFYRSFRFFWDNSSRARARCRFFLSVRDNSIFSLRLVLFRSTRRILLLKLHQRTLLSPASFRTAVTKTLINCRSPHQIRMDIQI